LLLLLQHTPLFPQTGVHLLKYVEQAEAIEWVVMEQDAMEPKIAVTVVMSLK
jgi:hypothetical protein